MASSSSCRLAPGPSGSNSKPRTARASGVGSGVVAMARSVAAVVKLEPKPEPWAAAAGAEEGPSPAVPRSVEGPPLPAPFVAKTYEMVADAATDAVVSWAPGPGGAGNSFVVWDPQALAAGILPRYFKHANFASFVRQLNIYGFRKVNPVRWEFANESFLAGQKHLLKNIKRRRASKLQKEAPPRNCAGACLGPPKDPSEVESLKRDHAALRAEVIMLRQQYSICKSQLVTLEERILNNERNQQRAIAFFAKVLSNPAFVQQVLLKLNYAKEKELHGASKRQRLMENGEHRRSDLPLRSNTEAAFATVVAGVSAGSSDDGTTAKQEPGPELNGQEMDGIWYDVWDELDAIPGAEMDQRDADNGVAGFDVEDFSGRPCGWDDDCLYLAEPMQFVEHYD